MGRRFRSAVRSEPCLGTGSSYPGKKKLWEALTQLPWTAWRQGETQLSVTSRTSYLPPENLEALGSRVVTTPAFQWSSVL